jgi:predicted ATP-grasp superfamily ATP-dependent carboligase
MKNYLEELEKYSAEMRKLFGEDFLMYLEQDLKKQLRIFEDFDKNTFAEIHNINYLTAVIANLLNSIVDQKNGMKVSASSM